jgi:hypothetical protein
MQGISPKAVEHILSQITNGYIFESFCKDFLAKLISYKFIPIGCSAAEKLDRIKPGLSEYSVLPAPRPQTPPV